MTDGLTITVEPKLMLAGLAGVVAVIGAFLPWATLTSLFGTVDVSGFKGDGKLVAVVAALMLLVLVTGSPGYAFVMALAGVFLTGYDLNNMSSHVDSISSNVVTADIGFGLYLCLGAFILATITLLPLIVKINQHC